MTCTVPFALSSLTKKFPCEGLNQRYGQGQKEKVRLCKLWAKTRKYCRYVPFWKHKSIKHLFFLSWCVKDFLGNLTFVAWWMFNKILFLLRIGDRLGSFRYNRRFCIHHKSFVIDSWVLKCNMNLFLLKQGWSLTTQSELLYTLHQFDCSPPPSFKAFMLLLGQKKIPWRKLRRTMLMPSAAIYLYWNRMPHRIFKEIFQNSFPNNLTEIPNIQG